MCVRVLGGGRVESEGVLWEAGLLASESSMCEIEVMFVCV